MRPIHVLSLLCLVAFTFFQACDGKKKEEKVILEGDTATTKTPVTKIQWDTTEFDFGKVKEGEIVEHTFAFKNVGDTPLIVTNARASCGCTIPEWTKDPILPGQEGKLLVKFNSSGKSGKNRKQITVTANTEPAESLLFIHVEVMKDENKK